MQNERPNQNDVLAVQKAVLLSNGKQIQNDWDLGHWITFFWRETKIQVWVFG
ncbi:MAG: hypothetical protein J4215_00760 [Candidatus Diapherotrites archaeon]|uniref:Uncharacterized protein n=1 Tax=Candidatus Iainarchaeum sp. TaxID=3101447 RepID=A0A8T4L1E9_9ARCH|nr:hypothetical protein [Candidatus Diapherotrites archaeon]